MQWSILWWGRHHRAHHQYTDTDQDPYNARRGFWFAHMGWLLGLNEKCWGPVNLADLEADPVVRWQHRHYILITTLSLFIVPTAIAHFCWNDWEGAVIYGVALRVTFTHHFTFLVNSLSHMPWAGSQPYTDRYSATNVPFVAIVAVGEGNHNYHHAFPRDYRFGPNTGWFQFDWGRFAIDCYAWLGLAWDLVTVSEEEVQRVWELQQQRRRSGLPRETLPKDHPLPRMSRMELQEEVQKGRSLIGVGGYVHDVSGFLEQHPGGKDLLAPLVGQDATAAYFDGVHLHSPHADAVLAKLRCAVLQDEESC